MLQLFAAACLLSSVLASPLVVDNALRHTLTQLSTSSCPQEPYTPPSTSATYFDSDEFRNISLYRLVHAVRHATEMYDDMIDPLKGNDSRWDTFPPWHEYLRQTYPLVHDAAKLELIGGYSLLYTFEGSTDSKPLMLTGHQDVVLASVALDMWDYPPFEGHFDGEFIWGRGSSDCKNNVIGLLSVMERLLETGFEPKRTIILAFGQDEEASGLFGARRIAPVLEDRYGVNGIELILDEGGDGLTDAYGPLIALPALAEKGYADIMIRVKYPGGHSSVPAAHTSVGLLARFIVALEDADMYRPRLSERHPYYKYLQCIAEHGDNDKIPSWLTSALANGDLDLLAQRVSEQSLSSRYMIQTSKAATIVKGGVKSNALPEEAEAVFNSRIHIDSSVDEHLENVLNVIEKVADRFGLAVVAPGGSTNGSVGTVELIPLHLSAPSKVSLTDTSAWEALSSAIRTAFGPHTIASPALMTGNTDTRNYQNLTNSIFRWSPARQGTRLNAHTINERVKLSAHIGGVKLYHALIMKLEAMV